MPGERNSHAKKDRREWRARMTGRRDRKSLVRGGRPRRRSWDRRLHGDAMSRGLANPQQPQHGQRPPKRPGDPCPIGCPLLRKGRSQGFLTPAGHEHHGALRNTPFTERTVKMVKTRINSISYYDRLVIIHEPGPRVRSNIKQRYLNYPGSHPRAPASPSKSTGSSTCTRSFPPQGIKARQTKIPASNGAKKNQKCK